MAASRREIRIEDFLNNLAEQATRNSSSVQNKGPRTSNEPNDNLVSGADIARVRLITASVFELDLLTPEPFLSGLTLIFLWRVTFFFTLLTN